MIRSKQRVAMRIGGKSVEFIGRQPTAVPDSKLRATLVAIGVARDNGDGTMTYIGVQRIHLKNGKKLDVPESGIIEAKLSDIVNTDFSYEVVDG